VTFSSRCRVLTGTCIIEGYIFEYVQDWFSLFYLSWFFGFNSLKLVVVLIMQESKSGELADYISEFVSLLPKSIRRVAEEPIPEEVQKVLEEAKAGDDHDHHHGHGHAHAGYSDAYGLGEEWTTT